MVRGSLEILKFEPRQVTWDAVPPDRTREREDSWSRLRREYPRLTSVAVALTTVALHAILVVPAIWERGPPQPPAHAPDGASDTALQWVSLGDPSPATTPASSLSSPPLTAVPLTATLSPQGPITSFIDGSEAQHSPIDPGFAALQGRYVGQIQARIDRAWLRPRTTIGAPIFRCSVQVDQSRQGAVTAVALLQCNGDAQWQLSLVHAIEEASPLPAPPTQAAFAHHVLLQFRAMAYTPGASSQLYAPVGVASEKQQADAQGASNVNAFQTLRKAARAQRPQILKLRIEGSKVEIEPSD